MMPAMERRRTIAVFAAGALAGAALSGLLVALLLGECAGGPRPDAAEGGAPAAGQEDGDGPLDSSDPFRPLSHRGVNGPCVFSGTVADGDGQPLAGALVGVRALDVPWFEADLAAEAYADETGSFALPGLAEGIPFQVWAFAPGMAVADVERPACGARLDFVLEPGARLALEARTGDGAPPGPLSVQIAGDPIWPPRMAVTDDRGRLDIEGLPPGEYVIWAGGGGLSALTAEPVALEAGEERTIGLALGPARFSEVRVEDDGSGAPIQGATVFARPRDTPLLSLVGSTDRLGSFRFADLAPVEHDLEVLGSGFLRGDPVPVAPDAKSVVRLRRGARVTGRVILRDGTPVAGARLEVDEDLGLTRVAWAGGNQREILGRIVAAQRAGFPPTRPLGRAALVGPALIPLPEAPPGPGAPTDGSWRADEDGRFTLSGLPPGRVVIGAFHPDLLVETPARLTLEPGGTIDGIVVSMKPGAALRVRTMGENGYPLREATVSAFGPEDEALASAVTGTDGFAELRGLPGRVRVEAVLPGHVPAVARIEVRPGQTGEVALTLPRADRVLRGRLTDQRGFGAGRAAITARTITRGLAHVLQGTSGPDGSFALEGAGSGDYHIVAELDGRPVAQFPAARAGEDVKLVISEAGAGPPTGGVPEFVTPEMVAAATDSSAPPADPGDDSGESLGVIAITETLAQGTRSSDYGYVDQLPVTGSVPGKGGLPVEIGGGPGNVVVKGVSAGSQVAAAGLRAGDRIVAVDGKRVQTPAQAREAIGGAIGSVVMIEVVHGGESVNLVVQRVRVR
jgi:hypothetical protein